MENTFYTSIVYLFVSVFGGVFLFIYQDKVSLPLPILRLMSYLPRAPEAWVPYVHHHTQLSTAFEIKDRKEFTYPLLEDTVIKRGWCVRILSIHSLTKTLCEES